MAIPNLLTIAGVDPSGGAGVLADVKTFARHGCYGTAVVTALTAQNTRGVTGVLPTPALFVREQLTTLLDDVRIDAVKIGMLGSPEVAQVVGEALAGPLAGVPVVLDPVLVATSGDSLGAEGVREAIAGLLSLVSVVTPNLPEAADLTGTAEATSGDEMAAQAGMLVELGCAAVLLKGGHLASGQDGMVHDGMVHDGMVGDLLLQRDGRATWLRLPRVDTPNTHGTGCTLSSAIAVGLARGLPLADACREAKAWLTAALAASGQLDVGTGAGHGPVNHFAIAAGPYLNTSPTPGEEIPY